ncbi:hypothetical protein [Bacillus pumilus]|uniref:hypothetical protein n=1 Tax=Bacillus pumilus TaxID=1408 RepID=UPI00269C6937
MTRSEKEVRSALRDVMQGFYTLITQHSSGKLDKPAYLNKMDLLSERYFALKWVLCELDTLGNLGEGD